MVLAIALSLGGCGDRYNLATAAGRQARIDDANYHLSKGECGAANEAIDPLYASPYVTDEVRILKASALACEAHFNVLTFMTNIAGAPNFFKVFAKSLDNSRDDHARQSLYNAVDVITQNGASMDAGTRSKQVNSFMVFLQFAVIGANQRNYGAPVSDGSQGADLVYETAGANPAGEMSNGDACALAAAFSFLTDSLGYSDLSDSDSSSAVGAINSVCTAAGLSSCTVINRVRTNCDGTNATSVTAAAVVAGVNAAW
jgi:hypothetical protein